MRITILFLSMMLISVFAHQTAISQSTESSDIFLATIRSEFGGKIVINDVENITNREGFDDQPFFSYDNKRILYTSIREDNQADTYIYNIETKAIIPANITPDASEFYPTDYRINNGYNVIREDNEGIWHRVGKRYDGPDIELNEWNKEFETLGVIRGVDASEDLEFLAIIGDSNSGVPVMLQRTYYRQAQKTIIAENIGRCLKTERGLFFVSYVQKVSEDNWYIKTYNASRGFLGEPYRSSRVWKEEIYKTIAKTLPGKEDFCWFEGNVYMGNGPKLYQFNPDNNLGWQEIADLSTYGIKDITRLDVNSDIEKIAIVSKR